METSSPAETDGEGIVGHPPRPVGTLIAPAPAEFRIAFAMVFWLLAWIIANAAHASHSGTLSATWWIRMGGFWTGWVAASAAWASVARVQKIPSWVCAIDPEPGRTSVWLVRRWWRHRQTQAGR